MRADRPALHEIASGGDAHPHHSSQRSVGIDAADQYGLQATAFSRAILEGTAAPARAPVSTTLATTTTTTTVTHTDEGTVAIASCQRREVYGAGQGS